MTPTDFKAYMDTATRFLIVVAVIVLFGGALASAFMGDDQTLRTALAQGALSLITLVTGFWFGASHKSAPPADTTQTIVTETKT